MKNIMEPDIIINNIDMLCKADNIVKQIHNNKDIYYIGKEYKQKFYITKNKIDNALRIILPTFSCKY